MGHAGVLDEIDIDPRCGANGIVLVFSLCIALYPSVTLWLLVEDPLGATARGRVEDGHGSVARSAVDQEGAEPLTHLCEVGACSLAGWAAAAIFADKGIIGIPKDQSPTAEQQLAPHLVDVPGAGAGVARQHGEFRV